MKATVRIIMILALGIFSFHQASAQCKTFNKNVCTPKLDPYIYNGQLNSASLSEGDVAELMLTFYSNQDYRLVVCGVPELGKIMFRLIDMEGKEIFSNKDHNYIDKWDFHTNSTQQLLVEISVPETSTGQLAKSGCVSILVGFLDTKD
jgi:hypothetical protein